MVPSSSLSPIWWIISRILTYSMGQMADRRIPREIAADIHQALTVIEGLLLIVLQSEWIEIWIRNDVAVDTHRIFDLPDHWCWYCWYCWYCWHCWHPNALSEHLQSEILPDRGEMCLHLSPTLSHCCTNLKRRCRAPHPRSYFTSSDLCNHSFALFDVLGA